MYLWWNLLTCRVSVTVGSSSLCLGGVFQVLINSLLVDLSGVELLKQYNVQLCDVQYNLRHAFLTIQFYHGLMLCFLGCGSNMFYKNADSLRSCRK